MSTESNSLREQVRAFLYGPFEAKKEILASLSPEPDDPVELVRSCLAREREGRRPGVVLDDHFELPHLHERHPEETLNFLAPDEYQTEAPTGLMVLSHGGGSGTPRDAARNWLLEPEGETGGVPLREGASRAAVCLGGAEQSAVADPHPTPVVAASRKGALQLCESPHHYWVSLDEVHFGTFELDHLESTESTPSYCITDFRHRTIRAHGGTVDAVNAGDNLFSVRTHNVDRFTLWLNQDMVDFGKPVRVEVNGELQHEGEVAPSLRTTLESFDRKRDEG